MQTPEIAENITLKMPIESKNEEWKGIGMENEVWIDIKDFEGYYQVSNMGIVQSLDRIRSDNSFRRGKILKQHPQNGYWGICLQKDKTKYWKLVHRLVGEAFISNIYNLPEINHKDLNRQNNIVTNLEWSTRQGNIDHAKENGVMESGENHHNARLNWNTVNEIRKDYLNDKTLSYSDISKKYKISINMAASIISNANWKNDSYNEMVKSDDFKNRMLNRSSKGEVNYFSKLKSDDILEIRKRHLEGETISNLSKDFNISDGHLYKIVKKLAWKHI